MGDDVAEIDVVCVGGAAEPAVHDARLERGIHLVIRDGRGAVAQVGQALGHRCLGGAANNDALVHVGI